MRSSNRPHNAHSRVKSGSRHHQRLSKEQLEWFVDHVNQRNHRERKAQRIALDAQADRTAGTADIPQATYVPMEVVHDPVRAARRFDITRDRCNLIVKTQLLAMERERYKTCQQKFEALTKIRPYRRFGKDIQSVRANVETETAEMAKRKLMMNYNWFEDLIQSLPDVVLDDRLCSTVLSRLCDLCPIYTDLGPDYLTRKRLFSVLSQLKPWERDLMEVSDAISFVRKQVIYLPDREFYAWRNKERQEHVHRWEQEKKQQRSSRVDPKAAELSDKKMRAATNILESTRIS